MSIFNWFRHKKRHTKKIRNSVVPARLKAVKAGQKHKERKIKQRNNDPKLTKKERLQVDSDGNVTVPAERTYAYTAKKIKHNGYNPHEDVQRRKFLFSKHIVYNPIEANTHQMRKIEKRFVKDKQGIDHKKHQISGDYIVPKAPKMPISKTSSEEHQNNSSSASEDIKSIDSTSQSALNTSQASSQSIATMSSSSESHNDSSASISSSHISEYSDNTSKFLSMAGSSDVSVNDLVGFLKKDTKRQLSMAAAYSDSKDSGTASSASEGASHSISSNSEPITSSKSISHDASSSSKDFVITSADVDSDNSIVDSLERPAESSSGNDTSSSSSSATAYDWAKSKVVEQKEANSQAQEQLQGDSSSSFLSTSYSASSEKSSISSSSTYATEAEFESAVSSAASSATSKASLKNSASRSQMSLNYAQKLEASYTAKSKSNDRKLARERAKVNKRISVYKRQEKARQQAKKAERSRKISSLNNDIKALRASVEVLGGSEAKAKSASASRASSASVARSVNAQLSINNSSNSRAMSLSASAYAASASSYTSRINSYDYSIAGLNKHYRRLRNALDSADSKASSANASIKVLKKQRDKTAKDARKFKALETAYIKSYRDLMKDEVKKQRVIRKNKRALAKAQKKNRQLVVVSKNNTDVLRKVSRLNTNVKQARNQMLVYKGQVTKLRKAYLILKKRSSTALVDAKQARQNKKDLELERAKNRKIRAGMHKLYDENVKGQKKNKTLQKTIIEMHRSSIQTIKQLRHNIQNQEKLKYNQKLLKVTNNMVNTDDMAISDQPFNDPNGHLSDLDRNSIHDNQLNTQSKHGSHGPSKMTVSGFKPTHHFTEGDESGHEQAKHNSSNSNTIPSRSQVHNGSSHSFLSGLFHHHDYDNNPSSYYTQNEVHSNQRIFLLRNVVQHSSKGLRTLKTGDKLYTTMLMPGPSGEDYKTNFLLRDGTSIPATKRTVKLID